MRKELNFAGSVLPALIVVFGVLLFVIPFQFAYAEEEAATSTVATTTATSTEQASPRPVHDAVAVEARVREFFADIPVMVEIARCESKFRQYADSGNVLRGGLGNAMLGVFQFNEPIHKSGASLLGFDIETLEGNLGYARHLYNVSGTNPWNSSFACWEVALPAPKPIQTTLTAEERAHLLAQLNEIIKLITQLQQLLALRFGGSIGS
jgi:hypothetical protein